MGANLIKVIKSSILISTYNTIPKTVFNPFTSSDYFFWNYYAILNLT